VIKFYRRHLFVSAAAMAASSVFDRAARAQAPVTFAYRGFTVDTTEAQSAPPQGRRKVAQAPDRHHRRLRRDAEDHGILQEPDDFR
jgi:hypothetical protein